MNMRARDNALVTASNVSPIPIEMSTTATASATKTGVQRIAKPIQETATPNVTFVMAQNPMTVRILMLQDASQMLFTMLTVIAFVSTIGLRTTVLFGLGSVIIYAMAVMDLMQTTVIVAYCMLT